MSENKEQASSTQSEETTTTDKVATTTDTTSEPADDGKSFVSKSASDSPPAGDGAAEGDGKGEDAAPEPVALTDIKLPEGVQLNEEAGKEFVDLLNNGELSRVELAQKLVDIQVRLQKEASDAISQEWNATWEKWTRELNEHPEVGGDKQKGVQQEIGKLIRQYYPEQEKALLEAFDLTMAGNNPHIVAFLARVAKALVREGTAEPGQAATAKSTGTFAQRLFPDLAKE